MANPGSTKSSMKSGKNTLGDEKSEVLKPTKRMQNTKSEMAVQGIANKKAPVLSGVKYLGMGISDQSSVSSVSSSRSSRSCKALVGIVFCCRRGIVALLRYRVILGWIVIFCFIIT